MDKELDIPIRNPIKQLELGICMECGKRKAKYLCDYITGKIYLSIMGNIQPPVSLYVDRPYIRQ